MKKQQDKNLLLFISIGVIAFLLLRKKPLQTQQKAGSGTGGNNLFSPANVSAAKKRAIDKGVENQFSKLKFTPIVDDWAEDKKQYLQDIKNCNV